jgi:hypothetical protein
VVGRFRFTQGYWDLPRFSSHVAQLLSLGALSIMNAIRAKIIASWLLVLTWASLIYFHHLLIAWCIFGLVLFIRSTKPKAPQLPQRIGYIVSFGLITFLVLVLIDGFYPFPPSIHAASEILAWIVLCPLLFYSAYLDCKAFGTTHDPSA